MQKMGLLRNVLKSGQLIRVGHQTPRISSLLRDSPRAFSTAGGSTTGNSSTISNPFVHDPNPGSIYGQMFGITSHTTKNDILNLLEDCKLTPEDLKVKYSPSFYPNSMLIQFPSRKVYDTALRTLARNTRGYRLVLDSEFWANTEIYDGKTVSRSSKTQIYDGKTLLLQGIPRNAVQDDIDRLLSGCQLDGTSMQVLTRSVGGVPVRMALVTFPSAILARLALLTTIRKFCLNSQVEARVLH